MKQLFLFGLIICTLSAGAQCPVGNVGSTIRTVDTAGALRGFYGNHRTLAVVYGKDSLRDGLGSNYMFDTASVAADDGYLHIVPGQYLGCPIPKGRWERVIQSPLVYPQGSLYKLPGGLRVFIGNLTTSSASNNVTVNLTTDNTPTGTSFFTSSTVISEAVANPSGFPVGSTAKFAGGSIPAGNKTATFTFEYSSLVTVALVGNLLQLGTMPSGTPIKYIVQGF